MEGLLQWVAERVAKLPREHRFAVGDRLLVTCIECIEVMENLLDASYRRDKHASLAAASRGLYAPGPRRQ